MNLIVDQALVADLNAGSKARADATEIARSIGFSSVSLKNNYRSDPVSMGLDLLSVDHQLHSMVKRLGFGDFVVIQFPFRGHNVPMLMRMCDGVRKRGAKSIAFVHDLTSIIANRGNVPNEAADRFRCDYVSLGYFDAVIVHNGRMAAYLVEAGISESKIVVLDMFDYLLDEHQTLNREYLSDTVSFAGNLDKKRTGFIYELGGSSDLSGASLELFGANYSGAESETDCVRYKGVCSPEELPNKLTGAYGLIWSGPSTRSCEWPEGGYLLFNNPHKLSLYYASNMVPIVWSQSAVAEFVKRTSSGIVLNSLSEIGHVIQNLDDADFQAFKHNAEVVGEKVRTGFYLKRALSRAMEIA